MTDTIKDLFLMLILIVSSAALASLLRTRKTWILAQIAALVQRAETAVQGSGMGAAKKQIVIDQLEAMGVTARAWMSTAIDDIVAALNDKRAWLTETAKDTLSETIKTTSTVST